MVYTDIVGRLTPEECLGICAYAIDEKGCSHIVIDNLMRVVAGEDNYNAQKDFVQGCCDLAIDKKAHIHLICHNRKGSSEKDSIDKFSVKGTSAISDQAANVIQISRNLDKEEKRDNKNLMEADDRTIADVVLKVVKQRNGDWQGCVPVWFNPKSATYSPTSDRVPPVLWERV